MSDGVAGGLLVAGATLWLAGCGTSPPSAPTDLTGWPQTIVAEPSSFGELVGRDRPGWVALHANDPVRAYKRLSVPARARAAWEAALLHEDLADLSVAAHTALYTEWVTRGAPGEGSAAWTVAGLSARCGGEDPETFASRASPAGRQVFMAPEPWADNAEHDGDPFSQRMELHRLARQGDLDGLYQQAHHPVLVEPADGFDRSFFDPCVHQSLAAGWWWRAASDTEVNHGDDAWKAIATGWTSEDLGGLLFAPWLTGSDLVAELSRASIPGSLGAQAPTLDTLDVPDSSGLQAARDFVRVFDTSLDRWKSDLNGSASDDGTAILRDIDPLTRYRHGVLTARAREALAAGDAHGAMTYAHAAIDVSRQAVGPANSASAYTVLAHTNLATGRVRESLDALQIVVEHRPEVVGLIEVLGDLAVLRGLDRNGDSKEN